MARGSKFFNSKLSELTEEGSRVKSNGGMPNGEKKGNVAPVLRGLNIGLVELAVVVAGAPVPAPLLLGDKLGPEGNKPVGVGHVGIEPKLANRDIGSSLEELDPLVLPLGLFVKGFPG